MINSFKSFNCTVNKNLKSVGSYGGFYKACTDDGKFCVICHSWIQAETNRWVQRCWHIENGALTKDEGKFY